MLVAENRVVLSIPGGVPRRSGIQPSVQTEGVMMAEEYIVLIHEPEWDPAVVSPTDWQAETNAHAAFAQAVQEAGAQILGGDALQPRSTAVRIVPGRDGGPAVYTDGPFVETKEVVTGYYKIGVRDKEQARELAALVPTGGWVELVPVMDTTGMSM